MPRRLPVSSGGFAYHVLNRAVGRMRVFGTQRGVEMFEESIAQARIIRHARESRAVCKTQARNASEDGRETLPRLRFGLVWAGWPVNNPGKPRSGFPCGCWRGGVLPNHPHFVPVGLHLSACGWNFVRPRSSLTNREKTDANLMGCDGHHGPRRDFRAGDRQHLYK